MLRNVCFVCLAVLAATLPIVIGCAGKRPDQAPNGGTGGPDGFGGNGGNGPGDAGPSGDAGLSGDAGPSGDAASVDVGPSGDAKSCPMIVRNGAQCSEGVPSICPITACTECIGGVWKLQPGSTHICLCAQGSWMCIESPGGGPIGDCIHEGPFTCVEAATLYTDATCTVHPSCTP